MFLPGIFKFNYYTLIYYPLIFLDIISQTQANLAEQIMHDNNAIMVVKFNYTDKVTVCVVTFYQPLHWVGDISCGDILSGDVLSLNNQYHNWNCHCSCWHYRHLLSKHINNISVHMKTFNSKLTNLAVHQIGGKCILSFKTQNINYSLKFIFDTIEIMRIYIKQIKWLDLQCCNLVSVYHYAIYIVNQARLFGAFSSAISLPWGKTKSPFLTDTWEPPSLHTINPLKFAYKQCQPLQALSDVIMAQATGSW